MPWPLLTRRCGSVILPQRNWVTATPCRLNRRGFTELFEVLVTSWSIAEFIEKGVLSVFDYVSIRPGSEEQRLIDGLEKRGPMGIIR